MCLVISHKNRAISPPQISTRHDQLWLTPYISVTCVLPTIRAISCADPEGGEGVRTPPPPGKLQKYRVFSNTGPDSLEIPKLPSQHSMTDHHRPASEMPFKWRFASGPIMAPAFSRIWILPQPYKMYQLKKGKNEVKHLFNVESDPL